MIDAIPHADQVGTPTGPIRAPCGQPVEPLPVLRQANRPVAGAAVDVTMAALPAEQPVYRSDRFRQMWQVLVKAAVAVTAVILRELVVGATGGREMHGESTVPDPI